MKARGLVLVCIALLALSGCYAARVETGLTPSTVQIQKKWAACWVYGLVPPSTVETAAKCPDGVAIVETKLSFLNMLVANLTLGIFTPMEIVVTCAQGSASGSLGREPDFLIASDASPDEVRTVFARAADRAVALERPVYIERL